MTDVQNGDRGDSRSGRSRTIACLLAVVLFFGSTITSSPAQEDASIMKNITVDCSAFKKEADGTWTTSRQSGFDGSGGSASGPVLSFPGLNLELLPLRIVLWRKFLEFRIECLTRGGRLERGRIGNVGTVLTPHSIG